MFWFCLITAIAGSTLLSCWLICQSHHTSRQANTAESTENSILLSQTASECCSMLVSLEDHKMQLRNRLSMLDEMIEKSDLEIDRLHEQLTRMNRLRSHPLDTTGRDMVDFLRAGGYNQGEIQHLTLRDHEELDDAA